MNKLIFEKTNENAMPIKLPATAIDINIPDALKSYMRNDLPELVSLNEHEILAHYRALLGNNIASACEKTYLCSVISDMSRQDGFTGVHPYQLSDASQGCGELMFTLKHMLSDMLGMADTSLQGTSKDGLFTSLLTVKANVKKLNLGKNVIILPEKSDDNTVNEVRSFGFEIKYSNSTEEAFKSVVDKNTAGAIVKIFDGDGNFVTDIKKIADILHENGALLVLDANDMQRFLGSVRPGEWGVDIIYFNAEKLFEISNYDGECDMTVVSYSDAVKCFMPAPTVEIDDEEQYYQAYDISDSVGKTNEFYGDFISQIRTIAYILSSDLVRIK